MYVSGKRYGHDRGYSIAYRQHLADSHCRYIHGYSLAFDFEFESETLDVRNWVCDFGGFRTLKDFLDEHFDHTLLVAQDDPELEFLKELDRRGLCQLREVEKTGCEGLSEYLFEYMNEIWLGENGYRGLRPYGGGQDRRGNQLRWGHGRIDYPHCLAGCSDH